MNTDSTIAMVLKKIIEEERDVSLSKLKRLKEMAKGGNEWHEYSSNHMLDKKPSKIKLKKTSKKEDKQVQVEKPYRITHPDFTGFGEYLGKYVKIYPETELPNLDIDKIDNALERLKSKKVIFDFILIRYPTEEKKHEYEILLTDDFTNKAKEFLYTENGTKKIVIHISQKFGIGFEPTSSEYLVEGRMLRIILALKDNQVLRNKDIIKLFGGNQQSINHGIKDFNDRFKEMLGQLRDDLILTNENGKHRLNHDNYNIVFDV